MAAQGEKFQPREKLGQVVPPPNPKVSPPWSPHPVEILTLVCSNKLNGGISTIELIWPTWVEISIHIQGCESNIHPPYFEAFKGLRMFLGILHKFTPFEFNP